MNWHQGAGKRNPKAWSASPLMNPTNVPFPKAKPKTPPKPPTPTNPNAGRVGDGGGGGGGGAGAGAGGGGGSSTTRTTRSGAAGAFGLAPLPANYAETTAGIQFDAPIREALIERDRLKAQGPQNQRDIGNWYEQVLGSVGKAATRDAAINADAQESMGTVTGSILSSLGGGANPGAGVVGAAGAEAVGTLKALGSAQEQYNEDVQPLLRAEAAGVSTREAANQSNMARQIADKIINLRGQRGQAETLAGMEALKYNNDIAQQGFQNTLATEQTALGAEMSGLDKRAQQLRNQLMEKELNTPAPGEAPAFVAWPKLQLPDKMNIVNSVMTSVLGPQGGLIAGPRQTFESAKRRAISMGYNNPQLIAMLRTAINDAHRRSKAKGEWGKAKPLG
jgi:hypothetical protein